MSPLIGLFSDRLRFRWGRRRPFILVGCILIVASLILMMYSSSRLLGYLFILAFVILQIVFYLLKDLLVGSCHCSNSFYCSHSRSDPFISKWQSQWSPWGSSPCWIITRIHWGWDPLSYFGRSNFLLGFCRFGLCDQSTYCHRGKGDTSHDPPSSHGNISS